MHCVATEFLLSVGELPVEKLMAMYNLQPINSKGAAMETGDVSMCCAL